MLYRMHIELYGMPREMGRWVIGIATFAMLIALISGIIIHKRIFKDLFTFQPKKKLRSWLDLHNVAAVLALPLHIVLTYSGLMLFMYMMMPWGVEVTLEGERRALRDVTGGKFGHSEFIVPNELEMVLSNPRALPSALSQLLNQPSAQSSWPNGVSHIEIRNPESAVPQIIVWEQGAESLLNRARADRWHFDSATGKLLKIEKAKVIESSTAQVYNVMTALHLQRYAEPFQRALFFMGGLLGTLMIGSGLHIWLEKRPIKASTPKTIRFGMALAKGLNVAFLLGLPTATVVAMWLNRLLPVDFTDRALAEVNGLLVCWLATFAYGVSRSYKQALTELTLLAGFLLVGLFFYNVHVLYPSLDANYLQWDRRWLDAPLGMQLVDTMIFITGAGCLWFGYRHHQNQHKQGQRKQERRVARSRQALDS